MFSTLLRKTQGLLACAMLLLPFGFCYAAQPLGCLIEPERIAAVGSQVIGVVESVNVERGDRVRKGQVLATLRSDVERASVQVASTRSLAEADLRSAETGLKLARVAQKRQEELVSKNFISQQALDKSHGETAMAEQKLAIAHEQLRIWNGELALARAQLNQRTIRSPIDGIITDRYIWPGERVEEKALFRVAKINPLRVEVVVSAALYGTVSKGMQLSVIPQLKNAQSLQATVVLVDKLIDGASNTFRIRAEIPNEDSAIPSGLRCKVELPDQMATSGIYTSGAYPAPAVNTATPKGSPVKPKMTPPISIHSPIVKRQEIPLKHNGELKAVAYQPVR